MCLAIPGKLVTVATNEDGVRMGRANFGGIVKEVCLEYTPEVQCGDYVLVHVGFALGKVDEEEAQRTYEALKSLDQLNELEIPQLDDDDPHRAKPKLDAGGTLGFGRSDSAKGASP